MKKNDDPKRDVEEIRIEESVDFFGYKLVLFNKDGEVIDQYGISHELARKLGAIK